LKGLRDRALLLLGFAGAFRRSELVALDVEDLEPCEAGLRVRIRRSKTDQEGVGTTIAIVAGSVACPVQAVQAWLQAAGIMSGPVFRSVAKGNRIGRDRLSDRAVANVIRCARASSRALRAAAPRSSR
jgi:site-specific recombinase XerC